MAVTPADVAVTLGRPAPSPGTPEFEQWALWIGYAERAIARRAERLNVDPATLDPDDVAMVVREAVAAKVRNPDGIRRTDLSLDDGRISKDYSSGTGQVTILPEWWALLFPGAESGAFSVRPSFEPDWPAGDPWRVS